MTNEVGNRYSYDSERRVGKTYTPATYAWHCLLEDGKTVIDPYK